VILHKKLRREEKCESRENYMPTGMTIYSDGQKSIISTLTFFLSAKFLVENHSSNILRESCSHSSLGVPRISLREPISGSAKPAMAMVLPVSGTRLEADVVSFALGGILIAYLLRPRWAVVQVFLSAGFVYVLLYFACPTYPVGPVWKSECYSPGPDGSSSIRLCAMMFSFGGTSCAHPSSYKEDK